MTCKQKKFSTVQTTFWTSLNVQEFTHWHFKMLFSKLLFMLQNLCYFHVVCAVMKSGQCDQCVLLFQPCELTHPVSLFKFTVTALSGVPSLCHIARSDRAACCSLISHVICIVLGVQRWGQRLVLALFWSFFPPPSVIWRQVQRHVILCRNCVWLYLHFCVLHTVRNTRLLLANSCEQVKRGTPS